MNQFFPHEKLDVYAHVLEFAAQAELLTDSWPITMAVRDQLERATESILINLATAARRRATDQGIYSLECSLGSVLESAACLDVAYCRGLVEAGQLEPTKQRLQTIARMEVGLRQSWCRSAREEVEPYTMPAKYYFFHESLQVYQRSLELHGVLGGLWGYDPRNQRRMRRIDDWSTSLTINIAEGNGRFSKLDHGKFITVAEDAGTKLSVCLDLLPAAAPVDRPCAKQLLREVMAMLAGLRGYLQEED